MSLVVDKLEIDAFKRTLGELVQDREEAKHEIHRLRLALSNAEARYAVVMASQRSVGGSAFPFSSTQQNEFVASALLSLKEVCRLVGLSKSTVYARVAASTFPAPVRVGVRSVRWTKQSLDEWLSDLQPLRRDTSVLKR